MKIVVDRNIPFIQGVLEKYAEVVYLEGREISRSDVLNADALIIRTRTECNRHLLEETAVRFIASATIGYDHIDTAFCHANNIFWTNAAGCNSSSVQQYIAAALFHLAEELKFELSQKTIGIVGVGNVGNKVARLCTALGMHVLLNDPPRERQEGSKDFVSLDTIVEDAEIVTFHVPLNMGGDDRTFHLVDEKLLLKFRKSQILINSSRGEVVDSEALKASLRGKMLAECVLDVWEREPEIDTQLLGLVEIGTPHIAGYSADGKANGTSMSVQAFSRFFGLDLNDWYPEKVPLPASTVLEADCRNVSEQNVIASLIQRTYDILADDARLRMSPQTFEKQRGEYPLRREFPTYTVKLLNAHGGLTSIVQAMGFKTLH
ncbi:MAG: 4-phosphoerythronate dehydrogenase PdxB [Ignavibacteria bacterium]|nr:4-phosphoerythronate dehydrogenase PdxB [Ignavibacteria bacterium]